MKNNQLNRMFRCLAVFALCTACMYKAQAQKDTSGNAILNSITDYDELFSELDAFLDSLTRPRSFTLVNIGVGTRMVPYQTTTGRINEETFLLLSPSIGYFDKSGLGLNAAASVLKEKAGFNPYQFIATASYDYQQNYNFLTGISFSRYFTKDSLQFYTSPLQNEAYAYFTYRRGWLRPMLSARYGWGSRTETEERTSFLRKLKNKKSRGQGRGPILVDSTSISTTESIADLSLNLSVRHDFYWLDVWGNNSFFRLTPQLSITGGTQKFGFNQNATSYIGKANSGLNVVYNSENVVLDQRSRFQPLSVTAFLRTELSKGKFFLQPQLIADYYLPASENKLTTTFMVNTGLLF